MQRPIVTIPDNFLQYLDCNWDIDWRGQSAGAMTDGVTKTVYAGFPRWIGQPQVFLHRDTIRQWRAIRAAAQGRRGIYRVALVDPIGFTPAETGAPAATIAGGTTFASGSTFAGGTGFAYEPFVRCAADAAKGATTVRVDARPANSVAPKQGQIMSHDDWPFVVTSVSQPFPAFPYLYDLSVEMPLRAAIAFDDPILMRGVGRFEAVEDGMGLASYGAAQFSRPTLSFHEVLRR